MIFVIPKQNQKAPYKFGTFKIFYYLISLFTREYQFQDQQLDLVIQSFIKQNQDLQQQWNNLGQVFFDQLEDKENMEKFIQSLKKLFQDKYIQKLKEILQILCAIIKLIHLNDQKQTNDDIEIDIEEQIDIEQQIKLEEQIKKVLLKKELKLQAEINEDQQNVQSQEEENIKYSQTFTNINNDEDDDEDESDSYSQINTQIEQINIQDNNDQSLNQNNNNPIEQQKSNQDQLKEIFQYLLGVQINNQNSSQIKDLFKNYSGKANNQYKNSNRILGYAQYLYQKLIQSFFIQVGLSSSNKIVQNKLGQATFVRFPDQIKGGKQANPFPSNCYFINLQRDFMECWFEIKNNQNVKIQQSFEALEKNTKLLQTKNDQKSIKSFFENVQIKRKFDSNLLVQISHKSNDNNIFDPMTIYEFDDFCKVNYFDIDEIDKQILMTCNLELLQKQFNQNENGNEKQLQQKVSSVVREVLQNFNIMYNDDNKIYIYKIVNNSLIDPMKTYIKDIKTQEGKDNNFIKELNKLYSNSHSEGESSDESSNESSSDKRSQSQQD